LSSGFSSMKTSSKKAKGRRLQQHVEQALAKVLKLPAGKDELVQSRPMSQSGSDVVLIGEAKRKFPVYIECKNQEKWEIPKWIRITEESAKRYGFGKWLLVMKRNRSPTYVLLPFEDFLEWVEKAIKIG